MNKKVLFKWKKPVTLFSWYQNICPGGSGPNRMVHVKFIVLPRSTNKSGPPNIVATGSGGGGGVGGKRLLFS